MQNLGSNKINQLCTELQKKYQFEKKLCMMTSIILEAKFEARSNI